MFLSKCAVRDNKKSRFIKEQVAKGLPDSTLSKVPILGPRFVKWESKIMFLQMISMDKVEKQKNQL